MKKALLVILLILYSFLTVAIYGQDFDLDIRAAILVESEIGQVLYEKNSAEPLPPASITKIMTLLIAMEEVEKGNIALEDEVTISKYAESMGGSQIYLAAGTRVPFGDLLKAITIASANDASVAVAEAIAGTYSNFINIMNRRAQELGMKNTHFENSTGLPVEYGEHYTTAYDIALMSRELVKYDQVLEWASIWVDYVQLPGREAMLVNTNKMINSYPGMDGLKTGHTQEAGYCLSATAERNGMRLISVVLGAETEKEREELTARLLDYGFNAFVKELMLTKGDQVHNVEVPDGKKTITTAEVAEDLYVVYKKGTKGSIKKEVVLQEDLKAPIEKGEVIGQELIVQDGEVLGQVDLLASESIEKAGFFTRLWRAFTNWLGQLIKGILD
ncbi:MAG TPA: D-alanyl-D-alanine carboxypeptidase [Halanaerobiaceae bacterium]|jgi:D-alanyl-D-alanine carboxypeptidase (penicillin-binding protein 5/6)|nr:D-alanyl-D-alanine carboxypeptidase family protein [Bacillota bacterium]HHU93150.1 D-alanyl-D-alanine carboxypeptidase [Halanaerobiaceae bacterium]